MDANNRQNRSTQQDVSQYSRYSEKYAQVRKEGLDQNVAFGTEKKPECFVSTWKNATHTWRWRAVLCVFLALLLVMMQPTGNALYRSWNAANGETMGIAAALEGSSNDLEPAMFTQTEGDSSDEGEGISRKITPGYIDPASFNGRLVFHREVSLDPSSVNYVPKLQYRTDLDKLAANEYTTEIQVNGGSATFWNSRLELGDAKNDYFSTAELHNVFDEAMNEDRAVETIGGMGKTTWVGEASNAGNSDTYVFTLTNENKSSAKARYLVWSLGYGLDGWVGIRSDAWQGVQYRIKSGVTTPTRDSDFESFKSFGDSEGNILVVQLSLEELENDVVYWGNESAREAANDCVPTLLFDSSENKGMVLSRDYSDENGDSHSGLVDGDVWPLFTLRTGYNPVALNSYGGEEYASFDAGISWKSSISAMFKRVELHDSSIVWELLPGKYDSEEEEIKQDTSRPTGRYFALDIYDESGENEEGEPTPDGTELGTILNPDGDADPRADPFYTGSPFYVEYEGAGDNQKIFFAPNYVIKYDYNGGQDTADKTTTSKITPFALDLEKTYAAKPGAGDDDPVFFGAVLTDGATSDLNILSGTSVTRNGYKFLGWAKSSDATEPDITWVSDGEGGSFTISNEDPDGDESDKTTVVTKLTEVEPDAVRQVYDTGSDDNDPTSVTALTTSVVYYAVWEEVQNLSYPTSLSNSDEEVPLVVDGTAVPTKPTESAATAVEYSLQSETALTYGTAAAQLGTLTTINTSELSDTLKAKYATGDDIQGEPASVTWAPTYPTGADANTTLPTDAGSRTTFTATVTPAKYTVTYEIGEVGKGEDAQSTGSWKSGAERPSGYTATENGAITKNVTYGEKAPDPGELANITPADGYYKYDLTDNTKAPTAIEGVWSKSVDDGSTWTNVVNSSNEAGTPATDADGVTGNVTYKFTLKPVHTVTFKASDASVAQWSEAVGQDSPKKADKIELVFDGGDLTTYATLPTTLPAEGYYKGTYSDGTNNAAKGAWYNAENEKVDSPSTTHIAADATYTYKYAPVRTVTFRISSGQGTWSDSSTADEVAYAFNGETATTDTGGTFAIPTGVVPSEGYYKTSGSPSTAVEKIDAASGSWDNAMLNNASTAESVLNEVTADAVYTYSFKRVYDITFKVGAGATWGDDTTAEKTGQYFHGDTVTAPEGMKAVTNNANAKYAKTNGATSGSWDATPPTSATANGTYTYNYLPVYTVTFKAGTGVATLNGNSNANITVDLFSSEKLQSSSIPTGMTASESYKKTGGATKGAWDTAPDTSSNASADVTYTYNYTPVYTVTLDIVNGYWSGTDAAAKTTQYFSGDTFSEPAATPGSSIGEGYVPDSWYKGDSTSTTKVTTWPSTVTANAVYTYKYKTTENTVTYTHQPQHADDATYKVADADLTITVNNGDMNGGGTKNYGDTITIPDLSGAMATGYTFKGWKITQGNTDVTDTIGVTWATGGSTTTHVKGGTFNMPNGEVNIYALWERDTSDVTWKFATLDSSRNDANATLKLAGASGAGQGSTITQKAEYGVLESALSAPALNVYNSDYYNGALTWYTDQAHSAEWTDKTAAIKGPITRYALPQDAKYTFTLTTVHGGFKVKGAVDDDNTFTSTNTYSYDEKTNEILTAENITFIEPSDTTNYAPYENYAFDSYSWTNDKDAAANDTILGEGAGTTSRSFTKAYNEYIPVTFKIYGGTWTAPQAGDAAAVANTENSVTYYVPDGESLANAGVLTRNGTDKYGNKSLPTNMAHKNGYEETGAWVGSGDSKAGSGTTWGATDVWDTDGNKADSPVASNKVYVYKFDEAPVPYKLHLYYQVATPANDSQVNTVADYEQNATTHPGAFTTIESTATYLNNVSIATILATNGVPAHLATTHFASDRKAPTGTEAGKEGLTADTFTMDNATGTKEIYLYFDRETVNYKYQYNNAPNYADSAFNTATTHTARWGQEITLGQPSVSAGYSFNGWYTKGGPSEADTEKFAPGAKFTLPGEPSQYTAANPASGTPALTTFTGAWSEGDYTVSYEFNTEESFYTEKISSDASNFQPKFELGDPATVTSANAGAPIEEQHVTYQRAAAVPTVDFGTDVGNKTYGIVKWEWKRDADADGANATGWEEVDSPSSVQIERDGYHFRATLGLKDYTVTYTAGLYGKPLALVNNVTKFTVHYGDAVPSVGLASDNYSSANAKEYGEEGAKYYAPEVLSAQTAHWQVHQSSDANAAAWELNEEYADNLLNGNKVGGDLVYDYNWDLREYTYTLHNVAGSSIVGNSTDTDAYPYTGAYNTTEYLGNEANIAKSGKLTWDDSVFAGLPQAQSDLKVLNPTKTGYQFAGWEGGDLDRTGGTVIKPAGQDIKVREAVFISGVSSQHLWASWTGNDVYITYNRNLTGGSNNSISWGSDATEVKAATATSASKVKVGESPMLDAVASLKTTGTPSEGFAPAGYTLVGWYENSELTGTQYSDQSTNYTIKPADADDATVNTLYAKWKAHTYTVQWKDFDNHVLTNKEVHDAEIDTSFTLTDENKDEPYQQTFTYNETGKSLKAMEKFFKDEKLSATHNTGDNVLKCWVYDGKEIADGAAVSTITPTDGEFVVLTPKAGDKVTLTYDFNAGTDQVSANASSYVAPIASQYGGQNVEFTLAPTVYRDGYTFAGWKIGDQTIAANGTWTSGTTDAKAVAQWTAEPRKLEVHFYKQSGLGSGYDEDTTAKQVFDPSNESAVKFTTGQTVTAGSTTGLTDIKLDDTQFPGYSYNSSKGNATTKITADGTASINLYYDMKAYTITFRYTPLTGAVSETVPPKTSEVVAYGNYTLPTIPTRGDAHWPTGYMPADSYWHVMKPNGSSTEDVTLTNGTLPVSDEYADAEGNIDVVLPWQREMLNVVFLLSDEAEYGVHGVSKSTGTDEVTRDPSTTAHATLYYDDPIDNALPNIKVGVSDDDYKEGYRFLGWTLKTGDTVSDALYDTSQGIKDPITLVAKIGKINSVTWAPGGHSAHGFDTAQAKTVTKDGKETTNGPLTYSGLDDPFNWESDASLTFPENSHDLVQSSDTVAINKGAAVGNLAAQPGWKFKNFTDEDGVEYASREAIYSTLSSDAQRKRSYTFTANWTETEQTVTFKPGEGAASTADIGTYAGKTNHSTFTKVNGTSVPSDTPAVVPAAPAAKTGYTFTGYYIGTFTNEDGTTTSKRLAPGSTFAFPAEDAELTAEWKHDKVTVTYKSATLPDGDGNSVVGGTVSNPTTGSVYADGSQSDGTQPSTPIAYSSQALPNPGFRFVGWVEAADYKANGANATKLTTWYDPSAAKFTEQGEDGSKEWKLNPEYGKLTIQKDNGLYKQATYIALFEKDPFNVTFVDSTDADGAAMGKLTVPPALNNQQVYLDEYAKMKVGDDEITREPISGYLLNDWSYTVKEEVLDAGRLKLVEKTSTSNVVDPSGVGIVGDTEFKAEYKPADAYLTFIANAPAGAKATKSTAPISGLKSGAKVKLPACGFEVAGYSFAGWSASEDAEDIVATAAQVATGFDYKLVGAVNLYALWTPNDITVKYYQNDQSQASPYGVTVDVTGMKFDAAVAGTPGDGALSSIEAPSASRGTAQSVTVPSSARRFVSWNTDKGGKGTTVQAGAAIPTSIIPANGELELFAQWENTPYNVTFLPGTGATLKAGKEKPADVYPVEYGQTVYLPVASDYYERKNYYFTGWQISNEQGNIADSYSGSTWTFKGRGNLGSSDTEISNVTFTAKWEPNPGIDAKVNITLQNMYPIPGTPNTQIAKLEGLDEDSTPLSNRSYEKLYELNTAYDADKYFTFRGWYAASSGANSPSVTFGDKESVLRIASTDVTVKDIVSTYYGTDKVLDGFYTNADGTKSDSVPEYWNADPVNTYTDAYKTESSIDLRLWRWAELSSYKVHFEPNAPWGYTDNQVSGATMEDQVLPVPDSSTETDPVKYKLNANTWSFPGYEFLGWQTAPSSGSVLAVRQTLNDYAAGSKAVEDEANLSSAGTALRSKNDTSYEVTLYAVWKPVDYTVRFAEYYAGDGITPTGSETVYYGDAKSGYVWGNAAGGGESATATISYNPDSLVDPTTYSADRPDVTFAGWYTQPNAADAVSVEGVKVNLGTDTIGGVISAVGSQLTAGATDITLYAKWAVNGARVTYQSGGASGTVPADQVQAWNDETGAQIEVAPNTLSKIGYLPDGWIDGTTVYHDGTGGTAADMVSFDKDLPVDQRTVTLTANFKDKDFTAAYNYDAPSATYKSQINTDGKGTPGKIGDAAQNGPNESLHWDSGRLYTRFDTLPALEGYTFKGFEYRFGEGKSVKVEADMTVAQLAQAVAEKGGTELTDDFGGTIQLYAVWEPAVYTVRYNLDGGTWTGGGDPTTTAVWTSNKADAGTGTRTLVIPQRDLSRDGFSEPVWYINSARTLPDGGLSTDFTLADLAEAWHAANGANGPLPTDITLYAKWKEDTVKILFTVSDTSNAEIKKPDDGTENVDYVMDKYHTQIAFNVGMHTGYINGDPLKGKLPTITAVASSGYKVAEWQNADGDTVSSTASYRLTAPNDGSDGYKSTTYEAKIAGDATVGVTLQVYVQGADGQWPADGSPTNSFTDLKASDFSKGLGESIAPADLDAKAREKMGSTSGLTFDASRTPSLEVSADPEQNVAKLYYSRSQYNLTFAWAYEEGEPSVPPTLPASQKLYVGQVSDAFAAPTAPEGYEWDGWRTGYENWNAQGSTYAGTTYTMQDANVQLTGVFKKSSYNVTWGTPLTASETAADAADLTYISGTPASVSVGNGQTLNSGYSEADKDNTGFKVLVTDIAGTADGTPLGNAEKPAADVTVGVKDGLKVTWKYTMGGHSYYTDDPTSVVVTSNVVFYPVVSTGISVTYAPGDHGDFDTSVDAGTRINGITLAQDSDGLTVGYKLADHLFPTGLLQAEDARNANSGNPKGATGWVFAGWNYRYVDNMGAIVDSATDSSLQPLSNEALATEEKLQNLTHGIELTATWKPATSQLVFDLDDQADVVSGTKVPATFKSGTGFSADSAGTATDTGSRVVLPSALDVDRPGFTLSKWKWAVVDDSGAAVNGSDGQPLVYELEPGDAIEMPERLLDTKTTLVAEWTEDTAVIEYKPVQVDMGAVTVSKEEVGVWTGVPKGSKAEPSRSEYKFVKWTNDGADASTPLTSDDPTFVPSRNESGMFESATYYASFLGAAYKVTFSVADGENERGHIEDLNGADVAPTINLVQTVNYGENVDMSDLRVVPENSYEVADGRYWDYVVYADVNGTKGSAIKHGTTDNPADPNDANLRIKGHTDFTVHFKRTEGSFPVSYDSRGGTAIEQIKRKWTDGNLGANKRPTKTGYTFNGWWTDIPGETPKAGSASDYDMQPGNTRVGTQSYGTLAGTMSTDEAMTTGITLRAGWNELAGFAVNFDLNYTSSPAATSVGDISWTGVVTAPAVPTRAGYVFKGWYTARNGGTQVVADADGVSKNTRYNELAGSNDHDSSQTVYAQWEERTYWVRYVDDEERQVDLKDYKMTATGLQDVAKPRDDTDALRWDGWYYANASLGKDVKVGADTTVEMIAGATSGYDIESNSKENPLVVKGVWKTFYRYDTKVLLFRDADAIDEGDDPYGLDKPETVLTNWAEAGSDVQLDFSELPSIPGFAYDQAATKAYLEISDDADTGDDAGAWAEAFSLEDIQLDYVYANEGEADGGQLFTVVYVARADYTLDYSLNDDAVYPGGKLAATTPDGASEYPAKSDPRRTFLDVDNTPEGWIDGETDPTRPGFTFGGWYGTQVADDEDAVPGVNATVRATAETPYGDLAYKLVDGVLAWYDPAADGGDGNLTLFAKWNELKRQVRYIVADDMMDRVVIRLNAEEDADYSSAERTEVIGAASGDKFVQADDGTWVRVDGKVMGAVAKANRGYTFAGWRVLDSTLTGGKTYDMPLGAGDPGADLSAVSPVMVAAAQAVGIAMATASVDGGAAAVAAARSVPALAAAADDGAADGVADEVSDEVADGVAGGEAADGASNGVVMAAQAEDAASSAAGQFYNAAQSITPGTHPDTHLFGGSAQDDGDDSASTVLYVATATQNASVNITFNVDGADRYTGPSRLSQPYGTFVGETAVNGVWGKGDGSLPDRNSISKAGSVFEGWKSNSDLTYEDETGNVKTLPAGTVIVPGTWEANHLIIPEGGLTLTAAWSQGTTKFAVTVPEFVNPVTGETVPALTLEVNEGDVLTNDQISQIVNRSGYYPDRWDVAYYDESGALVRASMTADELIAFLQKTPVTGDMTIVPAANAVWDNTPPTIPNNPTKIRPAKSNAAKSNAAKTGDSLVTTTGMLICSAVLAALVLAFVYLRRRQKRS